MEASINTIHRAVGAEDGKALSAHIHAGTLI